MSSPPPHPDSRTSAPPATPPPTDHTRWIAVAIEVTAIGAAIAFAWLHSAT